ncbi:inositol pentakisphosphate 2-kinase KNAG_0B02000 [Huiozyma naganishii CBS 8797]|uniref:Inositol-pentakisphosphate 2-kinase n=1 Tax=Huiozyma naganishii (strain ATCC MYA-139 / BCRC 22969 / CBS 8797 / KCTC 17520 / NBRC 10181 / NCYC 3082 / Yp74L-3) TaxID=1071383 RepID=J7RUV0_HUIN7|nr:hypothetical protein KNAG_0B02000 [Kazachstania naganishii CBS 8797]CCK68642.1 hypothetical protein KNAG_0B02000 [Kazachstania naganishii CBS 8797]
MRIVGKGKANILVALEEEAILYRICIRFSNSLLKGNEYTLKNYQYIYQKVEPLLGDLLCNFSLSELQLTPKLQQLLHDYVSGSTCNNKVFAFSMPNFKSASMYPLVLFSDHFTSLYSNVQHTKLVLEMKPKWLYNPTRYCRNCTANRFKGRDDMSYCYSKLLRDSEHLFHVIGSHTLPRWLVLRMCQYFRTRDNVLQVLHDIQKKLYCKGDMIDLPLLMTLRDVTCFVSWDFSQSDAASDVNIVDVDLKPEEKRDFWNKTQMELDSFENKCYHDY